MNPVLMDIPSEFYTERLIIRVPRSGDGKMVYESIQASIIELKQWLPFAREEQTEEKIETNLRNAYAKFLTREDMRLLIFLKENNEFIGSSGLHNPSWRYFCLFESHREGSIESSSKKSLTSND
jgi:ribosomal-protein-serine acetyltransferase